MLLLLVGVVLTQNGVTKWSTYVSTFAGSTIGSVDGPIGIGQLSLDWGSTFAMDSRNNSYFVERNTGKLRQISLNGTIATLATGLVLPTSVIVDKSDRIWICEHTGHRIRLFTNGVLTSTIVGSTTGLSGFADGQGASVLFSGPAQMTLAKDGTTIYISEWFGHRIRKLNTLDLTVTLLAGSNSGAVGDVLGDGSNARFSSPAGITTDNVGNVYLSDSGNQKIKKITPSGTVTTYIGTTVGFDDGDATIAKLYYPNGLVFGSDGYMYVASGHAIRMISPERIVSTIAGGSTTPGYSEGVGLTALFNTTLQLSVDNNGDLLFSTWGQTHLIYKLYLQRNNPMSMLTYAHAWNTSGYLDGALTNVKLYGGFCAFDSTGKLFIADFSNYVIRTMTASAVSTFSVTGSFYDYWGGPRAIDLDSFGNVYVTEADNFRIIRFSPSGVATVLAGGGCTDCSCGGVDHSTGTNARFCAPFGIKFHSQGYLLVVDSGYHCIRKVLTTGTFSVSTVAGLCNQDGYVNGNAATAKFNNPRGIATDSQGNIYVADTGNHAIRIISTNGIVSTFAGKSPMSGLGVSGYRDGTGLMALFDSPIDIAIDKFDTLYITDKNNHRIRMIKTDGIVTSIAGNGVAGTGTGYGPRSMLNAPYGIAISPQGDLFVSQQNDGVFRKILLSEIIPRTEVSWFIGTTTGTSNGDKSTAQFRFLWAMSFDFDQQGNAYVADDQNNAIRKILPDGTVTTISSFECFRPRDVKISPNNQLWVACVGDNQIKRFYMNGTFIASIGTGDPGNIDGGPTVAQFNEPNGIVFNSNGDAFVTDSGNHCIRRISSTYQVTTFAGSTSQVSGTLDGVGTAALISRPRGLTIDSNNVLYFTGMTDDLDNYPIIRKITTDGTVTTIAGRLGVSGSDDGPATTATFVSPAGIAIDHYGNLFVTDMEDSKLRMITKNGHVVTIAGSTAGYTNNVGPLAQFTTPHGLRFWNGSLYVMNKNLAIIQKVTLDYNYCSKGTYLDGGVCRTCPLGTYTDFIGAIGVSQCKKCPSGTYSTVFGATSLNACTLCSLGTFNPNSGSTNATACQNCIPGTFSNIGSSTCTACSLLGNACIGGQCTCGGQ